MRRLMGTELGQVEVQTYDNSVSDLATPEFVMHVSDLYTCQPNWGTTPPEGIEPLSINGVQVNGSVYLKAFKNADLTDPASWKVSSETLRRFGCYENATANARSKFWRMAVTLATQMFTPEFQHEVEVESKEQQVARLKKAVDTAREKLDEAQRVSVQAWAELEILKGSTLKDGQDNCRCDDCIEEGLLREP